VFRSAGSRQGKVALLADEKPPFFDIFFFSVLVGGNPGRGAENREWGQREALAARAIAR
jgi:hypothetical protein